MTYESRAVSKQAHSVVDYRSRFGKSVTLYLKEHNDRDLFDFCAHHMAVKLKLDSVNTDGVFITFPPEKDKSRKRFSHSEELAKALARELYGDESRVLPLVFRRSDSEKQKTLGAGERRSNALHSYYMKKGYPAPKKVLLVDDVITTGSTLKAIKRLLLSGGAESVLFCTFASTCDLHGNL